MDAIQFDIQYATFFSLLINCTNALYGRDYISTVVFIGAIALILVVSMPYTGGTTFLHVIQIINGEMMTCVNALYGRDYISTSKNAKNSVIPSNVSMPYTGGTTFLHKQDTTDFDKLSGVNALYGRDYISTTLKSTTRKQ